MKECLLSLGVKSFALNNIVDNGDNAGTVDTGNQTTDGDDTPTTSSCNSELQSNCICNEVNNNAICDYDGGDCCLLSCRANEA